MFTQKITVQSEAYKQARQIRHTVFVEEQGVSAEEEYDEFDVTATHFLATDDQNVPCGTARWRFTDKGAKLERFAVLPTHRKQNVGLSLVKAVLQDVEAHPEAVGKTRYLHAQETAIGFYEKLGFKTVGEPFYEANIKHMKMVWG